MATLSRVVDGGILNEKFEYGVTPIWSITTDLPERVVAGLEGGIVLRHGNSRVSMLTNAPIGDFIFQARISHQPQSLADIGGIMIQADVDSRIECQTYYNGLLGPNQYFEYMKIIRVGDRYSIYASIDGGLWEPMGATLLPDSHQIGFFLDGPESEQADTFLVKELSMYKSSVISFIDLPRGVDITLKDSGGTTLMDVNTSDMPLDQNKILFDVSKMVLPIENATITVSDNGSIVAQYNNVDVNGGDVFDFTYSIIVLLNDEQINTGQEQDMGYVNSGGQEFKMTIINKEDTIMIGKRLSIVEYSDYFRGSAFADMALATEVDPTFEKYVDIPNLLPDERIDVLVKIKRDASSEAPFFIDKYKFKIILE